MANQARTQNKNKESKPAVRWGQSHRFQSWFHNTKLWYHNQHSRPGISVRQHYRPHERSQPVQDFSFPSQTKVQKPVKYNKT